MCLCSAFVVTAKGVGLPNPVQSCVQAPAGKRGARGPQTRWVKVSQGEGLRPRGRGGSVRSVVPALGGGAGEGGGAEFTEPAGTEGSQRMQWSSPTPGRGGCGVVGVLGGVSALAWPSGDRGGGWCPWQRRGTGEAQAWGHLAQRRVGATPSEDHMKPVYGVESPPPLSLPSFQNACPHAGPQGAFRGKPGLPPTSLSAAAAGDPARAHGFCQGQRGFIHVQGHRAHGKHERQV